MVASIRKLSLTGGFLNCFKESTVVGKKLSGGGVIGGGCIGGILGTLIAPGAGTLAGVIIGGAIGIVMEYKGVI